MKQYFDKIYKEGKSNFGKIVQNQIEELKNRNKNLLTQNDNTDTQNNKKNEDNGKKSIYCKKIVVNKLSLFLMLSLKILGIKFIQNIKLTVQILHRN